MGSRSHVFSNFTSEAESTRHVCKCQCWHAREAAFCGSSVVYDILSRVRNPSTVSLVPFALFCAMAVVTRERSLERAPSPIAEKTRAIRHCGSNELRTFARTLDGRSTSTKVYLDPRGNAISKSLTDHHPKSRRKIVLAPVQIRGADDASSRVHCLMTKAEKLTSLSAGCITVDHHE